MSCCFDSWTGLGSQGHTGRRLPSALTITPSWPMFFLPVAPRGLVQVKSSPPPVVLGASIPNPPIPPPRSTTGGKTWLLLPWPVGMAFRLIGLMVRALCLTRTNSPNQHNKVPVERVSVFPVCKKKYCLKISVFTWSSLTLHGNGSDMTVMSQMGQKRIDGYFKINYLYVTRSEQILEKKLWSVAGRRQ